ncbi:MAG: fatty acid desaturase [Alphaproteobacteria bacterium]|nr:fatty acid desaturase [Alphaproteobacteria bacterium]
MSGDRIKQQFSREFRNYEKPTVRAAWFVFASYVGQIIAAVAIGVWLLPATSFIGIIGVACLAVFIATRMRGLQNIVHECCHATFADDKSTNRTIGRLAASLALDSFETYRSEHMTHHAHTGDYEHDDDLKALKAFRLEDALTPATVIRHALTPLLGLHFAHYVKIDLSAADGGLHQRLKLALIIATIIFTLINPIAGVALVLVPYLWLRSALNYWTDCIDHAGLIGNSDALHQSRNALARGLTRVVLFPRNDCFHLVHHMFPMVPSKHLSVCHDQLMADPAYQSLHMPRPVSAAHTGSISEAA